MLISSTLGKSTEEFNRNYDLDAVLGGSEETLNDLDVVAVASAKRFASCLTIISFEL